MAMPAPQERVEADPDVRGEEIFHAATPLVDGRVLAGPIAVDAQPAHAEDDERGHVLVPLRLEDSHHGRDVLGDVVADVGLVDAVGRRLVVIELELHVRFQVVANPQPIAGGALDVGRIAVATLHPEGAELPLLFAVAGVRRTRAQGRGEHQDCKDQNEATVDGRHIDPPWLPARTSGSDAANRRRHPGTCPGRAGGRERRSMSLPALRINWKIPGRAFGASCDPRHPRALLTLASFAITHAA